MKKMISFLIIVFLITSCKNTTITENTNNNNSNLINDETPMPTVTPYTDTNPIIVGLYQNGKLINNIDASITNGIDIASFDVYFTNVESTGSTNTKNNFNKYLKEYEEDIKYKIGFYISFQTQEKKIEATIKEPNIYATSPYIYNYLYDDIHQNDGAWYSHVETEDVTEDTIYSSIKLYAAEKANEIISPITLTVFTYDSDDDFDELGNYRGNSKYTIKINKK